MSMSLFVSGLATFIQCRRFGPIGAGLLCIQGTSFSFISPIIGAGMLGMINGKMNIEWDSVTSLVLVLLPLL